MRENPQSSDDAHDEGCYYLVHRPVGKQMSETVDRETMDKLVNDYGLDISPFFDNARRCDNKKPEDIDRSKIWLGEDGQRYPPCFFSITYVKMGGALDFPMTPQGRSNDPDDWVDETKDLWNEPREKFCSIEAHKDFVACGGEGPPGFCPIPGRSC
jgi:hypothetical protein